MKILLTNDDGIFADGIIALYRELKKVGDVVVVAPESEQSSVGHAITLAHPIYCKKVKRDNKFFGYAVGGTPADCVKFALDVILKKKPDIIVSGINLGDNDGCSVHYSGTVAGAREGVLMGIPSMAVSLASFTKADFRYAAKVSAKLARVLFKNRSNLPKGTFLNVNVPDAKPTAIKGIRVTRQGTKPIHAKFHKRVNPGTKEYYWLTGKMPTRKNDLTVDTYALNHRYVTVTPIQCDSTDYVTLDQMKEWKLSL